jgi:hypothetical protein
MTFSRGTLDRGVRTAAVGVATLFATAVVVLAFLGLGAVVGEPFELFSRDAADALEGPFYTAWFSELFSLIWNLAAIVALFGAAVLRRSGNTGGSRLLAIAGVITAAMALDDLFLLHDDVYPAVGLSEKLVYPVYFLAIAAYTVRFRRRLGPAVLLIAAAAAMWAVSAGVDLTVGGTGASFVVEDGLKAAGVALWAVMLVRLSWAEVCAALSVQHPAQTRSQSGERPAARAWPSRRAAGVPRSSSRAV